MNMGGFKFLDIGENLIPLAYPVLLLKNTHQTLGSGT